MIATPSRSAVSRMLVSEMLRLCALGSPASSMPASVIWTRMRASNFDHSISGLFSAVYRPNGPSSSQLCVETVAGRRIEAGQDLGRRRARPRRLEDPGDVFELGAALVVVPVSDDAERRLPELVLGSETAVEVADDPSNPIDVGSHG